MIECFRIPCLRAAADHVVEGTIKLGGQEHFYLEPNGAIVVPTESDEYLLISSTQAPNKHQVTAPANTSLLSAACSSSARPPGPLARTSTAQHRKQP